MASLLLHVFSVDDFLPRFTYVVPFILEQRTYYSLKGLTWTHLPDLGVVPSLDHSSRSLRNRRLPWVIIPLVSVETIGISNKRSYSVGMTLKVLGTRTLV